MRTSFFGLETALRALEAQRGAVEVAAHNIANAQTPGYSRQVARLTPTAPYRAPDITGPVGPGTWGTGVEIGEITRIRDAFLDRQVVAQTSLAGRYEAMEKTLSEVEATLNEPGDSGLAATFDAYWQAWQDVAQNPESLAARQVLLARASALGEDLAALDGQWISIRQDVDGQIADEVSQFNRLADQVAALNRQIVELRTAGQNPNDLLDQRDQLVEQMASIVPIETRAEDDGSLTVWQGGVAVVEGFQSDRLLVDTSVPGGLAITWASTGQPPDVGPGAAGSLGGLLDLRERVIPGYRGQLAAVAQAIAVQTNAVHRLGISLPTAEAGGTSADGYDFFVYTAPTATQPLRLELSPDVAGQPENVAAALPGMGPGDGSNALDIAALLDTPGTVGAASIEDAYRGLVGQVGADSLEASTRNGNTQALLQSLEGQRQSVEGVSLDEEMARLVQFQHGYNAAARVFTAVDEMIDTVVRGLGLVGR
ncbi:MAG: flagellar hook-associated protein FlgK [Clostridia bacterium]|nr:flagellar hook-associated protein FlgK [Clostridia bacterium]